MKKPIFWEKAKRDLSSKDKALGKIIQNLDLIVKKDGSEVTFEKNGWDPFE